MKTNVTSSIPAYLTFLTGLYFISLTAGAQEVSKSSAPLPENINKIISFSCMPCHSSTGGILSRMKLNFTNWTGYSPDTQQKKAAKIYSELKKGGMPPKSARETRPEIIPTKDQIDVIKKWSDSLRESK